MSFYLERMKEALEGDSILLPRGLSREEKREFLLKSFKIVEANVGSMGFVPAPFKIPQWRI